MVDKRTQKLVEKARQDNVVQNFREANAREKVAVDFTAGGEMVRVAPATLDATFEAAEIERGSTSDAYGGKQRDYLQQAQTDLESSQTNAVTGLINVKTEFDKLLDPNTGLEDLVKMCGTMSTAKLEESKRTIELIKNSQEYRKLEQEVKSTEIELRKNDALLILQQFEAQIEIARKANKIARDHDNFENEVEMRSLNQQRNHNDQVHVADVNNLRKEDQEGYRDSVRKRMAQQEIIRNATVKGWTANAKVADHRANIKTAWADRLTQGSQPKDKTD